MIEFKKFDEFMSLMRRKYETKFYILFFILKILLIYSIFFVSSFAITYFVFGKNFRNWESLCSIILAAIFTIYLLIRWILKFYFNFFLKRNIFKSFFAVMFLLKLSFNWKKYNCIDEETINIIKTFSRENLALQGSMSILWSNSNFYRKPNDMDFISMSISNKYLLNDLSLLKNDNLKIEMDNIFYKLAINDHKIEILQPKLFAAKFFRKKNDVFIPKLTWQIAMKYVQIFDCVFNVGISQEKIKESVIDLAFLLTDRIVYSKNIIKTFILNSLSNLFVKYFTNNATYSFDDEEYKSRLDNFFKCEVLDILKGNNLSWIYKRIFSIYKKIVNDEQIKAINSNINNLLQNKDDLYKELLSLGNIKSLSSLKIYFDTKEERELAYSKIIISPNVAKLLTYFPYLVNEKKQIDVRYYLLSKLSI